MNHIFLSEKRFEVSVEDFDRADDSGKDKRKLIVRRVDPDTSEGAEPLPYGMEPGSRITSDRKWQGNKCNSNKHTVQGEPRARADGGHTHTSAARLR